MMETDNKVNQIFTERYEEELPRYTEILSASHPSQPIEASRSSSGTPIDTYTLVRFGLVRRNFHLINDKTGFVHFVKTKPVSATLYDTGRSKKLKIRKVKYTHKTISWNIVYKKKYNSMYRNINLTYISFKLKTTFNVRLTRHDGEVVEYNWMKEHVPSYRWILYPVDNPNLILMRYTGRMIGKCELEQYHHVIEENLNIFLLVLSFALSYD